jgi:hypothetical protein
MKKFIILLLLLALLFPISVQAQDIQEYKGKIISFTDKGITAKICEVVLEDAHAYVWIHYDNWKMYEQVELYLIKQSTDCYTFSAYWEMQERGKYTIWSGGVLTEDTWYEFENIPYDYTLIIEDSFNAKIYMPVILR